MSTYNLNGYVPPIGISNAEDVKRMQRRLGVTADGVWGPKSQAAYLQSQRSSQAAGGGYNRIPGTAASNNRQGTKPYTYPGIVTTGKSSGTDKKQPYTYPGIVTTGKGTETEKPQPYTYPGIATAPNKPKAAPKTDTTELWANHDGSSGGLVAGDIKSELDTLFQQLRKLNQGNPRAGTKEFTEERGRLTRRYNWLQECLDNLANYPNHQGNVDAYLDAFAPYYKMASGMGGPWYDPLLPEAEALQRARIGLPRTDYDQRGNHSHIDNEYYMKQAGLLRQKYGEVPILLTKETLNNPYAATYADLLSLRGAKTKEQRQEVRAALDEIDDYYSKERKYMTVHNAYDLAMTRAALSAKLGANAALQAAIDTFFSDATKRPIDSVLDYAAPGTEQLAYLAAPDTMSKMNQDAYSNTAAIVTTAELILSVCSIKKGIAEAITRGIDLKKQGKLLDFLAKPTNVALHEIGKEAVQSFGGPATHRIK